MPFPTYDTKEAIPAGAEDVYEEREGKWHPKIPDTSGMETALERERRDKKEAERRAREAEAAKTAAERERDTLKAQVGDPEGKTAELLKKFDADLEAAVKAERDAREAAEARVRTLTLDAQADAAFTKAGGRAEKLETARKLYRDRLDLSEDRPVVKDDKGQVTTKSLEDFFKDEFKKMEPELYTGTRATGGGAGGMNGGTGTGGALTAEDLMRNPGLGFETANATT